MQILGLLGMPPRATHPITASPGPGGGSQGLELAGSSRPSLPLPWGSGLKLVLDTVVWGPWAGPGGHLLVPGGAGSERHRQSGVTLQVLSVQAPSGHALAHG